jgi:hypothetical protein
MSEHMLILECEVGQPVIDNGSPIPISRHILGLEAHHASQKGFLRPAPIQTRQSFGPLSTYQDGEIGGSFFLYRSVYFFRLCYSSSTKIN